MRAVSSLWISTATFGSAGTAGIGLVGGAGAGPDISASYSPLANLVKSNKDPQLEQGTNLGASTPAECTGSWSDLGLTTPHIGHFQYEGMLRPRESSFKGWILDRLRRRRHHQIRPVAAMRPRR